MQKLHRLIPRKLTVVTLDEPTDGAARTCLAAAHLLENGDPLVIYTPDVTFGPQFNPPGIPAGYDAMTLVHPSESPSGSYVIANPGGIVFAVAEKQRISNMCNAGVYCFARGVDFVRYAQEMIQMRDKAAGEYHIAPVLNYMIQDGKTVAMREIAWIDVLGTPEELKAFEEKK